MWVLFALNEMSSSASLGNAEVLIIKYCHSCGAVQIDFLLIGFMNTFWCQLLGEVQTFPLLRQHQKLNSLYWQRDPWCVSLPFALMSDGVHFEKMALKSTLDITHFEETCAACCHCPRSWMRMFLRCFRGDFLLQRWFGEFFYSFKIITSYGSLTCIAFQMPYKRGTILVGIRRDWFSVQLARLSLATECVPR